MTSDFVSVTVRLPRRTTEMLDKIAKLREFDSRSSIILRACEFFAAQYSPRHLQPPSQRSIELEKGLKKLLERYEAAQR